MHPPPLWIKNKTPPRGRKMGTYHKKSLVFSMVYIPPLELGNEITHKKRSF